MVGYRIGNMRQVELRSENMRRIYCLIASQAGEETVTDTCANGTRFCVLRTEINAVQVEIRFDTMADGSDACVDSVWIVDRTATR